MKKRMLLFALSHLIVLSCMSQIRYVDINPDTVLLAPSDLDSSRIYTMDLNNDSILDYQFTLSWCSTSGPWGNQTSKAKYFACFNGSFINNLPAVAGDTVPINSSVNWQTGDLIDSHYFSITMGIWYNQPNNSNGDKYFAIKLKIDSAYHYGWIRANNAAEYLIFKEYAYNLVPEEPIIAGDTNAVPSFIKEINSSFLRVFPNPTRGIATIQTNLHLPGMLVLCNIWGEVVLTEQVNDNVVDLNLEDLENGVYYLRIENSANSVISKIIKI